MPRHAVAVLTALVLAVTSAAACKSGSPGSSGGPPCMGANPNQACYDCEMSACPMQFAAVESACGAFLACEAQCSCSDLSCLEACGGHIDGSCASADDALKSCLGSACMSTCSSSSSGTGTSSGGMAPSCAALSMCCPQLPSNATSGCMTVVNANNDSICMQQLDNYKGAGFCGSSSGGMSCAKLSTCCAAVSDPSQKQGCEGVVQQGNDANCASTLSGFESAGLCP